MAGALSGHILEQYHSLKFRSTGPFGMPINPAPNNRNFTASWPASSSCNGNLITSGAMSFNQNMHGVSQPMNLTSDMREDDPTVMDLSQATAVKIAALQAKLNQQLGPEYISTRPGPGGGPKLVYAEGWKIINLANEVFGFNGWSSSLVNLTTDFVDYNEETSRYSVGVTAIVRVTLRDGVYHEDIGYGLLENSKTKGPALDKCKKEAVTDGLKRALRNFGNLLGNCLYDKAYTNEIVKVKANPPKFDKSQLHRRPEFAEPKPNVSSTSTASASTSNTTSADSKVNVATSSTSHLPANTAAPAIKSEPPLRNTVNQPTKPLSSVPLHVRKNLADSSSNHTSPLATSTPVGKGNTLSNRGMSTPGAGPSTMRSGTAARNAAILNGLSTPVTPANQQLPDQVPPQPPQQQGPEPGQGASKKVSFTESPLAARGGPSPPLAPPEKIESDEGGGGDDSFMFGSDDDAFLATVDLGEGDLGRPIDFEVGLGTSRDANESVSGGEDGSFLDESVLDPAPGRQQSPSMSGPGPQDHGQTIRQGQAKGQSVVTSRAAAPALNCSSSSSRQQVQQRPSNMTSLSSTGSASGSTSTNYSAGFSGNNANASSTPVLPPRRGGFTFPPELSGKQAQPQPLRQIQQQASSGIGVKRTAESMRSLPNAIFAQNSRRPMQGMGLMSAGAGGTRQPFGMDLSHQGQGIGYQSSMDGGDAKRVKR